MNLEQVFTHILYSSSVASIMILVMLLIKKLFNKWLSTRYIYLLWILIFIRLLMPLDIANPLAVSEVIDDRFQLPAYQEMIPDHLEDANPPAAGITPEKYENTSDPQPNRPDIGWLSDLWFGCFIALLLLALLAALRFKYHAGKCAELHDPEILSLVKDVCRRLKIKRNIPVYTYTSRKSPGMAGILNPRIYFPPEFCSHVNHDQLEHVILHELAHYKRRDLIFNLAAGLAALVHWFNPFVWLAVREMKYDQEIALDSYVLELIGEQGIVPYGTTILNVAGRFKKRPGNFNLVGFNENPGQIERRIRMIKIFKKGSYKVSLLAVVSLVIIGLVTLTSPESLRPVTGNLTDRTIQGQLVQPGPEGEGLGSVYPIDPNQMGSVLNEQDINQNIILKPAFLLEKSGTENSTRGQLVLLDPGHGGEDWGAVYPYPSDSDESSQLKEKDFNLDIALKLKSLLEKSGVKVALSRETDDTVPLDARIAWAGQQNAALLVSIHCNSHFDASIHGTQTYAKVSADKDSQTYNEHIASIIQEKLVGDLHTADLGCQTLKIRMLNEVPMLAISPQIAFISNESDREKLKDENFRSEAAQALCAGIIEALREM